MRRGTILVLVAWALSASCSPLATLGVEQYASETEKLVPPYPEIADDRIEDKHPAYDAGYVITERIGPCYVTLNKSASVTKLDIMPFGDADGALADRLFPTYADALTGLGERPTMPSMELVQAWAWMKPFNDGLYGAVGG